MNKKASMEAKIVEFFETADLRSVEIVLGIVKEKVRARQPQTGKTRARKTKANGATEPLRAPLAEVLV